MIENITNICLDIVYNISNGYRCKKKYPHDNYHFLNQALNTF